MVKKHEIRNSTAEFLIFQAEGKEQGVEVYYKDENIWATQKAISILFDCDRSVVTKHLGNVFESLELIEERVCAKFAHTAGDGKTYNTKFYSLDAIVAVGYRVIDEQPGWTKYCFDSEYGKDGFTDRKNVLESSDDAASVNWGETWRTPTFDEILELHENCTWTWIRVNGVVGYKVMSKVSGYEGRYIFIPASGMRFKDGLEKLGERGCYWSSELEKEGHQGKREPFRANYLHMDSKNFSFGSCARYYALTVRPVCSKN